MQEPIKLSICNQKGGMGKTTFTTLLSSYLQYNLGLSTMVVDCDYPQNSIYQAREREFDLLSVDKTFQQRVLSVFRQSGNSMWPVIKTEAHKSSGNWLADQMPRDVRFIFYDLPGSISTPGVLNTICGLDHVFVPMKADKIIMESSLSFATTLNDVYVQDSRYRLKGVHLFWTMVDLRERTPLYDQYETIIAKLGLPVLKTTIPYRSKFNKEVVPGSANIFRSTLLPAEKNFVRDSRIGDLLAEIISIVNEDERQE